MSNERDHYGKYEAPPHETVLEDGPFEVRRYRPYVVAKTTVDTDDFDKASNEGFRRLAGYIFGGNQGARDIAMTVPVTAERPKRERAGEKIAMTVPVGTEREDDGWRITFMMPSRFDLDTLPVPNDPRVQFERKDAHCRAAVRFSWLTTEAQRAKKADELRAWAEQRGLRLRGDAIVARYDAPLTLPWNRRNEIWFDVDDGTSCLADS